MTTNHLTPGNQIKGAHVSGSNQHDPVKTWFLALLPLFVGLVAVFAIVVINGR